MLVYTLDLSDVIGSLDLSVGVHQYTIGTVYVTVFVIPDVPLGTLATILAMFGALGLCKNKNPSLQDNLQVDKTRKMIPQFLDAANRFLITSELDSYCKR